MNLLVKIYKVDLHFTFIYIDFHKPLYKHFTNPFTNASQTPSQTLSRSLTQNHKGHLQSAAGAVENAKKKEKIKECP